MSEIKNSLEKIVLVRSGSIFGKTDQCSKTRFDKFPGLRFYKKNFHVIFFPPECSHRGIGAHKGSELQRVVALLLFVFIQAYCGQLGVLLCMYLNCSCMKV